MPIVQGGTIPEACALSACSDCNLPGPLRSAGSLLVVPPFEPLASILADRLRAEGYAVTCDLPGTLSAGFGPGELSPLAAMVRDALPQLELANARGLLLGPGEPPGPSALLRLEPLDRLLQRIDADWLVEVLRAGRLASAFQPIFDAHGRLVAHECLLRGIGPDGAPSIPPGALYGAATTGQLLFALDRMARLTHIRNGASAARTGDLFINFTPAAIYNPAFCLRSTVEAVKSVGIAPERVVFEVVETERINDLNHLAAILSVYRAAGFRVALDDFGSGFSSLALLERVRPDIVKIDMGLIRNVDTEPYRASITARIIELARSLGIVTLAEGIETPGELAWCRQAGADYFQGYYLGRPAAGPLPAGAAARAA